MEKRATNKLTCLDMGYQNSDLKGESDEWPSILVVIYFLFFRTPKSWGERKPIIAVMTCSKFCVYLSRVKSDCWPENIHSKNVSQLGIIRVKHLQTNGAPRGNPWNKKHMLAEFPPNLPIIYDVVNERSRPTSRYIPWIFKWFSLWKYPYHIPSFWWDGYIS